MNDITTETELEQAKAKIVQLEFKIKQMEETIQKLKRDKDERMPTMR